MYMNKFDQIVKEYFDLSDSYTRHYFATLDEADQGSVLDALSSALYDKIVARVDDIDFGTIPKSRGDITQVDGYATTMQCIDIMRKLAIEYKQSPELIDVISSAIANVKDRKSTFMAAYGHNVEFPMVMYNLIVLSIENSVSYLIATTVQYIKDPSSTSLKIAMDKIAYAKAKDDLIYKQLIDFNKMCANKSLDKIMDSTLKNGGRIAENHGFYQEQFDLLTEAKRSELPDSEFGLPKLRKYPLDTEAHVRSAIKFFNFCKPEDEKELAKNIKKAIKKFGITDIKYSARNRFFNYYKAPEAKNESVYPELPGHEITYQRPAIDVPVSGEYPDPEYDDQVNTSAPDYTDAPMDTTAVITPTVSEDDEVIDTPDGPASTYTGNPDPVPTPVDPEPYVEPEPEPGEVPQDFVPYTAPDEDPIPGADVDNGVDGPEVTDDVEARNIPPVTPDQNMNTPSIPVHEDIAGAIAVGSSLGASTSELIAGGISGAIGFVAKAPFNLIKMGIDAVSFFVRGIIPFLRNLVYRFYYTRAKLSNMLETQAELVNANANELEYNNTDIPEEKKRKIIEKQRKSADRLRRLANIFSLDKKRAEVETQREQDKEDNNRGKVGKTDNGNDALFGIR